MVHITDTRARKIG